MVLYNIRGRGWLHGNAEVRPFCHSWVFIIVKGSVESTHKVPTSHYHTKHCHAAVVSLGGLTHRCLSFK